MQVEQINLQSMYPPPDAERGAMLAPFHFEGGTITWICVMKKHLLGQAVATGCHQILQKA